MVANNSLTTVKLEASEGRGVSNTRYQKCRESLSRTPCHKCERVLESTPGGSQVWVPCGNMKRLLRTKVWQLLGSWEDSWMIRSKFIPETNSSRSIDSFRIDVCQNERYLDPALIGRIQRRKSSGERITLKLRPPVYAAEARRSRYLADQPCLHTLQMRNGVQDTKSCN
jgi:hypothetical protein